MDGRGIRLILVRHGETPWTREGRFQGAEDTGLTPEGVAQAERLAKRLAREAIDAAYASDLKRAVETARRIMAGQGSVRIDPRFRELDFGAWEGLTYSEVQARYPLALARWEADPMTRAPHGGESLGELFKRLQGALDEIKERHWGQTVLIVAHGGSLQVLLCLAFGLTPQARWQFNVSPASLSELFLYEDRAVLTLFNDTCHLKEGEGW